jgi:hypothetical protein
MEYTEAVICERWPLKLGVPGGENAWFVDWVLRSPVQSGRHVTASYEAYLSLRGAYPQERPFGSALEYFGGLGCQSLIIRHLFSPPLHTVCEIHPEAVKHLRTLPGVQVEQLDSLRYKGTAELLGMDYGNLTIHKAQRELRPMLERAFDSQPKAVVLTDIAGPHLHLHRQRYAEALGHECSDYPQYLHGLAAYWRRTYGYRVLHCSYHRWSAVMSLVPEGTEGATRIEPVSELPRGIVLQ